MKLQGTITAMITPMKENRLDEEGLLSNIRFQLSHHIDGIVLLATTGESMTLSAEEQQKIISLVVKEAKGKVPIIAATGCSGTFETIEKTKRAKDLGADVAMIVTPFYNKPTQDGLFRHYETIVNSVDIPILLYNNPTRAGVSIDPATLARLVCLPNMIGLKDCSGNICLSAELIQAASRNNPDFRIFAGDDVMALPMISLGAKGVISVLGNLIPNRISALVNASLEGEMEKARAMHYQLLPLIKAAFVETNPVPIKEAMRLCGMPAGDCRAPLFGLSPENKRSLETLLLQMSLLS